MKKLTLILSAVMFMFLLEPTNAASLNTKPISKTTNIALKDDVYLGLIIDGETGFELGYYIQDFTTKNITFYYDDGTIESVNYSD